MRRKIVAGNWKMNKTLPEGKQLASEVINIVADEGPADVEVIINPPFIHLAPVVQLAAGQDKVKVGAQNCSEYEAGAYTGEVSAVMLRSVGVGYVIIGHSERRQYFGETSEQLAKKINRALEEELQPIFCCGEPLEVREEGAHFDYVCTQLTESLFHLTREQLAQVIIAYEPIWAIGTGQTASAQQAQEMHARIRAHLATQYGEEAAAQMPILYGGSCKPSNARELFANPDVDGGLIGGASLNARDFVEIVKSFS